MSSLRLQLARNTLLSMFSYLLSMGVALFLTPMVLSALGAAGYGAWMLILQVTGYAGLLDLGLQPAVAKAVAEAQGSGSFKRIRKVVGTALALNLCLALLALLFYGLFSSSLLTFFHLGISQVEIVHSALLWVVLGLALNFPATMFTAILKGTMSFDQVAVIQIAMNLVRASGTIYSVKFSHGLIGLAQASLAANATALFLAWGFAWQWQSQLPWRPVSWDWLELRGLVSFSGSAFLAQGGWFLAYATDSIVIGLMLTAADIAYFGLPVSVFAVVIGLTSTLAVNFLPLASRLNAQGDRETMRRSFMLAVRYSLLMAVPMVLVIIVFGPALLAGWVGVDFAFHATPVLRILACSYLCVIGASPAMQSALGLGMQSTVAIMYIAEGIINVGVSITLAPKLGLAGVALGTLVPAFIFHGLIWPLILCRKIELPIAEYFQTSLWPVVLPLFITIPISLGLHLLLPFNLLFIALLSAIAVPLTYWILAWFTCFNQEQRNFWKTKLINLFGKLDSTAP
jgi:O-antigen/teichoic acid export membrane protein